MFSSKLFVLSAVLVASTTILASAEDFIRAEVELQAIKPTVEVCGSPEEWLEYDGLILDPEAYDCFGSVIEMDGDPLTLQDGKLPDGMAMHMNAPEEELYFDFNGTFRVDVAAVVLQPASAAPVTIAKQIGDSVKTTCRIFVKGQMVDQVECGDMWIQAFVSDDGTNHVCRLNFHASVDEELMLFQRLTFQFEIPAAIRINWEDLCTTTGEELQMVWGERYYYTGFSNYNHDDTYLEVTGGDGAGADTFDTVTANETDSSVQNKTAFDTEDENKDSTSDRNETSWWE